MSLAVHDFVKVSLMAAYIFQKQLDNFCLLDVCFLFIRFVYWITSLDNISLSATSYFVVIVTFVIMSCPLFHTCHKLFNKLINYVSLCTTCHTLQYIFVTFCNNHLKIREICWSRVHWILLATLFQPAIICSKLTIETLEQGMKYVQSKNKDTRTFIIKNLGSIQIFCVFSLQNCQERRRPLIINNIIITGLFWQFWKI